MKGVSYSSPDFLRGISLCVDASATHPVSSPAIPCPHRPKPTSSQPSLSSPSQPSLPQLAVYSPPSRCLLSSTSSPCDPALFLPRKAPPPIPLCSLLLPTLQTQTCLKSLAQASSLLSGCFSCSFPRSPSHHPIPSPRTPTSASSYNLSPEPQTLVFNYELGIFSSLALIYLHSKCCHYLLPHCLLFPRPEIWTSLLTLPPLQGSKEFILSM